MLSDYPGFLTCLAFCALFCIWFFRKDLELERPKLQFIFGSIFGGIAGNLSDRLFRGGEVVDFIDPTFHFLPASNDFLLALKNFPVFNLADSAIFIGVIFYLIVGFLDTRRASLGNSSSQVDEE